MDGKFDTGLDAPARARALIPMLESAAERIETAHEMPADVLDALHDARMFRLLLPQSLGGDELDLATHAATLEALAEGDASAAWVVSQGGGCAMGAAYLDDAAASKWFGGDRAALAWGAGIQGKAIKAPGGFRITGKWTFGSGSRHATLLGGHSFVFEADGVTPVKRPDGSRLDRTALFRRDQAEIDDVWDVLGLAGTGSDTFAVNDVFVADEDTIDRETPAERQTEGPLYKVPSTVVYGLGFAALQLGIARAMLRHLRQLAMTKTPRGVTVSLRENPVFHSEYARLEARLRSARAYLMEAARDCQRAAEEPGELALEARADLKLASVHVIHAALDVTTDAYRAAGSTAIFNSGPYARRLRDALTASQQTQARAQNFVTLGRMMMGLDPESTMFL